MPPYPTRPRVHPEARATAPTPPEAQLERRTARGGKDGIDHAPRQHDDVANSAAGALVLAAHEKVAEWATWGDDL